MGKIIKNNIIISPLFDFIQNYLSKSASNAITYIFTPYIKTNILEKLINKISGKIIIITTWNPNDLLSGSSELELYPFCKENRITLYINDKIHLKVYSVDLESAIVTSGNISNNGLMPGGNYECGAFVDKLSSMDRLYFEKIRINANLVNDEFYELVSEWYQKQNKEKRNEIKLEDIVPMTIKKDFLISALPMTKDVDDLSEGYEKINLGLEPSEDSEIVACIYHDLANYNIQPGLSKEEFIKKLKIQFFAHPFIQKIDEFINPEAYFGRIKEWVQNNCVDVPIPSRRELTENVQVLYEWFEKLGDGKYIIDVPGAHSERIRKIK